MAAFMHHDDHTIPKGLIKRSSECVNATLRLIGKSILWSIPNLENLCILSLLLISSEFELAEKKLFDGFRFLNYDIIM